MEAGRRRVLRDRVNADHFVPPCPIGIDTVYDRAYHVGAPDALRQGDRLARSHLDLTRADLPDRTHADPQGRGYQDGASNQAKCRSDRASATAAICADRYHERQETTVHSIGIGHSGTATGTPRSASLSWAFSKLGPYLMVHRSA